MYCIRREEVDFIIDYDIRYRMGGARWALAMCRRKKPLAT